MILPAIFTIRKGYYVMSSDIKNEEQLVQENTGFVIKIAKSFNPSNATELDEYIQSGRIGLLKAIRLYNPKLGYKLCSLAGKYIVWEILNYIKSQKKYANNVQLIYSSSYNTPEELWEFMPDSMTDSERKAFQLRHEGNTYAEIGQKCGGYSRGWANRLCKSAIDKVKKANAS